MDEAAPIFDQVNVISSDLERTLAFYRLLGLDIGDAWKTASGTQHATADTGEGLDLDFDSEGFARVWNRGWEGKSGLAGRVVLGFRLATRQGVDARYTALTAAGYRGLQAPYDAFWGARYAIVEDPDGLAVGLMSPVDPAKRTAPPGV